MLSDVDLAIHAGSRVGVIGRNGCGKSSLFAAVQGEIEADKGDVDVSPKLRIASVDQQTPPLRDPAIQFVLAGDAEVFAILQGEAEATANEDWDAVAAAHQKLAEINGYDATARAGRLLHGLGFTPEMHELPVSDFSGGWRARLNLAQALMCPSDLLLLDEPTNHLDLDAILWLEGRAVAGTMAAEISRHADDDLARPRVPRWRQYAHAAPARGSRQALHRRLHQFRAAALRATQTAADRVREGTNRARPSASLHRSIQGVGSKGEAGAVTREALGKAFRHRSRSRRASDSHQFSRSHQVA